MAKGASKKKPPDAKRLLALAVLRYHTAIQSCAGDPQKMVSYCTAQGESLDGLYWSMVKKAHATAGLPEPVATQEKKQ